MFIASILWLSAIWSSHTASSSAREVLMQITRPTAATAISEMINNRYLTEEERAKRIISLLQRNMHRSEVQALFGTDFEPEVVAAGSMISGYRYSTDVNRRLGIRISYDGDRATNVTQITPKPFSLIPDNDFSRRFGLILGDDGSASEAEFSTYGIWSTGGMIIKFLRYR